MSIANFPRGVCAGYTPGTMLVFEWTILLLVSAVILAGIARRIRVPYPAFLALVGAGIAFLPAAPTIALDPALALALFVAPVLLDAAYDTSLRDLKRNWFAIGSLAVFAVVVTTGAVALSVRLLVPDMPWAAAVALGAVVAPPDAAAATAVLRQVRLPRQLLIILEGESLLNDATSLLIFRAAVGAVAVAGTFDVRHAAPMFVVVVAGSVAAGWALARLYMLATWRVQEVPSSIVLQFVGTFGVWLLADRVGLSAVLTVVAYGITVARRAPVVVPARVRVPSYAVWETGVFVLNVMAFLLIGLQLRPIWGGLSPSQRHRYLGVAVAVLVVTVAARFAWVMLYVGASRWKVRLVGPRRRRPTVVPSWRGGTVVSWCGMRGIVTIAAALALPEAHGKSAFPYRELIVFCAFAVVFGTLVLQGFTLRPLLSYLKPEDDGCAEWEETRARTTALQAALDTLEGDSSPVAGALRVEYEEALRRVRDEAEPGGASGDGDIKEPSAGTRARRAAVAAARNALVAARSRGDIGDDAFHRVEEDLDWLEMSAGGRE